MRIAILTEGDGEFKALPRLYPQLREAIPRSTILRPLKVATTPYAAPGTIAQQCISRLTIAKSQQADRFILLLDREQQDKCSGVIADSISSQIIKKISLPPKSLYVVLKDRTFENWLIADPDALRSQRARFRLTVAFERAAGRGGSDRADALSLLKAVAVGSDYDKIEDADRICARQSIGKVASNSRSFRHFLHAIGHPDYQDQCRQPVRVDDTQPASRRARRG
ncbi:hypothetical protein GCM10009554_46320 [Kribbella koreensis]|uniref:DUF4276 family protein n=1 Tax=Kribbella koreensis TaxID=57909 RepID=A0ABP4BFA8_9ACTN